MDAAQLRAFITVAELSSFSKAADLLHLTQPAVSKRISALENQLGQRLFDRIGHSVLLTPAGHTLLPRATRLLLDLDDVALALRNLSGRVEGTLRIATSHHIGLRRLPEVLREYTRRFPDVTLEFDFVDSELAYAQVESGERELAVVTLPQATQATISALPLWAETLVPAASSKHPLSQLKRCQQSDLAAHRVVLLPEHTFTQHQIKQMLQQCDIRPTQITTSTYLESIAVLVAAGQGWAFLPDIMLGEELLALAVPKSWRVTRELGVVHHRERTLSNAGLAMLKLLEELV